MADMNASDSAISTDDLEIDSYDDVVKLLGADDAASMLADVAGNRFNREDIMRAILNGEDIHLDYWPDYEELEWATRVCGELLADTSLEWADGFIDAEKIETHEGLTVSDLSHAVECVLTDKFNDGLYEASLVDRTEIADTFAQEIKSRLDGGKLGHGPYVDSESLRDDLTERFGFFYDIDFSGLTFKTSLILSVKSLYFEGDVVDSALDWQGPPTTTGRSRVPRTSPRASSTSCAPRRARPSRRSSTTPLPSSSAASARISSTRSRTRSSVSPSWQPCLSMRSWTPASR